MKQINIAYDKTGADKARAMKQDSEIQASIDARMRELRAMADQLVAQITADRLPDCPCVIYDLIKDLPDAHLESLIKVQSFLAALKIDRDENGFSENIKLVSHAIQRRAELAADAILGSPDIFEP